ncbi:uncharacterized protein TRIADDRAFT_28922, partial [Trichoplax adhaerens]
RISELFDIIIDFPESKASLEELKLCMERNDLRKTIAYSLRNTFETRLLHPGANTNDILDQYISAIHSLRIIDPSGIILDVACYPIRKYLSSREDTIRCIISNLTSDTDGELAQQLARGNNSLTDSFNESDTDSDEDWSPDPVDAIARKGMTSGYHKKKDVLSMLVTIYGSKQLFSSEYRNLLAHRLLTLFDFNTDKEIRYLELLKLKFGETNLSDCEVMLKDVKDSCRISDHIQSTMNKIVQEEKDDSLMLNTLIISENFWPKFKEEKLKLPPKIEKTMTAFAKHFEKLKAMRGLHWKYHLGLVNIQIEIANHQKQFSVTPLQASIIYLFQEKVQWTIEEISEELQVSSTILRRKISYWINQGLLKETPVDSYNLVEDRITPEDAITEDDETTTVTSAADQHEEEQELYWSYIVGMLTNFPAMELDRICSSLKLFIPSAGELSSRDLKMFLDKKVQEQKLTHNNGEYALVK